MLVIALMIVMAVTALGVLLAPTPERVEAARERRREARERRQELSRPATEDHDLPTKFTIAAAEVASEQASSRVDLVHLEKEVERRGARQADAKDQLPAVARKHPVVVGAAAAACLAGSVLMARLDMVVLQAIGFPPSLSALLSLIHVLGLVTLSIAAKRLAFPEQPIETLTLRRRRIAAVGLSAIALLMVVVIAELSTIRGDLLLAEELREAESACAAEVAAGIRELGGDCPALEIVQQRLEKAHLTDQSLAVVAALPELLASWSLLPALALVRLGLLERATRRTRRKADRLEADLNAEPTRRLTALANQEPDTEVIRQVFMEARGTPPAEPPIELEDHRPEPPTPPRAPEPPAQPPPYAGPTCGPAGGVKPVAGAGPTPCVDDQDLLA
jgi:hypothetical protein